ncbi:MAG: Uma2 family endonuclease [Bacteroidota bacterium]
MAERAVGTYDYAAYLEVEREADMKYEYHDGMITAMAGGSPEHGQIAANFTRGIGNTLGDRPCSVYSSDVKIRVDASNRTFYPDVSVVCGQTQKSTQDPNALVNPILIVEVLSESTAAFDLGVKFDHYRQLASLQQYILISQDETRVHSYYRTQDGTWEIHTFREWAESIFLKSVQAEIKMSDIYRRLPGIDPQISL